MGHTKTLAMEEQQQAQTLPAAPSKSIYNISNDYLQLMREIEDADGELTEDTDQRLTITKDQLETKAVNYGYLMRQLKFEEDQISAEIERLQGIKSSKAKTIQALEDRVSAAMELFSIDKIDKNNLRLSFREAKYVFIADDATIPKKFTTTKIVTSPDKKKLKEYLESGKKIKGVLIQKSKSLQIK